MLGPGGRNSYPHNPSVWESNFSLTFMWEPDFASRLRMLRAYLSLHCPLFPSPTIYLLEIFPPKVPPKAPCKFQMPLHSGPTPSSAQPVYHSATINLS